MEEDRLAKEHKNKLDELKRRIQSVGGKVEQSLFESWANEVELYDFSASDCEYLNIPNIFM